MYKEWFISPDTSRSNLLTDRILSFNNSLLLWTFCASCLFGELKRACAPSTPAHFMNEIFFSMSLSLTDHLLIHRRRPLQIEMASCDSMWVILPFLVWAYSKCSNWRGNKWWNKHIWCFDHYFKHVGPNNACERIFRFEHFMTDLLNLNEHYNKSSIIHLLTFLAAIQHSSQAFWLKRKYFDFQNRVTNNNNFLTESWPKLNLYHSVRQFSFFFVHWKKPVVNIQLRYQFRNIRCAKSYLSVYDRASNLSKGERHTARLNELKRKSIHFCCIRDFDICK